MKSKIRQKQRGQIFSIDLIIAIAIAFLALGLLLAIFEVSAYKTRSEAQWQTLKLIAFNASNKILHNKDWLCKLTFSDGSSTVLPNCIKQSSLANITKQSIGIPDGYNCKAVGINIRGCNSGLPNSKDVFTIKREFVSINSDAISKEQFYVCLGKDISNSHGSCPLSQGEFSLSVWRA